MSRCLYCYRELEAHEHHFHAKCARKFFGRAEAPTMDYSKERMVELAMQIIQSQTTVTGVQPKISLHMQDDDGHSRLTIVGLWGNYIFKPQTEQYACLPEVEDLTMHLAELAGIYTVPHTLIRMSDGSLGYLTRRIDRTDKGDKIAMEDLCQLSNRRTENKYHSSYEQVAKVIVQYSSMPRLDVANFMELVLFCWITGNNDMHLKNFSLYNPSGNGFRLTPAYDLVSAAIVNPSDADELALTLNGKRRKLTRTDFRSAAERMGLPDTFVAKTVAKFAKHRTRWQEFMANSFLPGNLSDAYLALIDERINRLVEP